MSDGRAEREQERLRQEREKREDREDQVDRGRPDEAAPERGGS